MALVGARCAGQRAGRRLHRARGEFFCSTRVYGIGTHVGAQSQLTNPERNYRCTRGGSWGRRQRQPAAERFVETFTRRFGRSSNEAAVEGFRER